MTYRVDPDPEEDDESTDWIAIADEIDDGHDDGIDDLGDL